MKMAIIGGGNMGEAIIRGVIDSGILKSSDITVSEVVQQRRKFLSQKFRVKAVSDSKDAVMGADLVVLAVKPQNLVEIMRELSSVPYKSHKLWLSVAAGVKTSKIEKEIGEEVKVIRAMPNTPALVREGITAVCLGKFAVKRDLITAEKILGAIGEVVSVSEELMDAVTAITGSGPAYIFYMMELLIDSAVKMGINYQTAKKMVIQLVKGSAILAESSNDNVSELKNKVVSKGGTTEQALKVLEEDNFPDMIFRAVKAAEQRSKELSE